MLRPEAGARLEELQGRYAGLEGPRVGQHGHGPAEDGDALLAYCDECGEVSRGISLERGGGARRDAELHAKVDPAAHTGLVEQDGGGEGVDLEPQPAVPLVAPPPVLEREERDWYLEQLIVIEGDLGEMRQGCGEGCGEGGGEVGGKVGGGVGGEVGGKVGGEGGGEVGRKGGEGVVREVQGEQGREHGPRWESGDAVMGEVEDGEGTELGDLDRDLIEVIRAQVELGEAREAGEGG